MTRYRYEEGDYRPRCRSGGECDRCALRSSCGVDDERLFQMQKVGSCAYWKPDELDAFAGV